LVDLAQNCEFCGWVRRITEVESDWDPENPSFRAIIADDNDGTSGINVSAEGPEVCKNVHPLCKQGKKMRFRGGELKMDYSPKTLSVEWNDETAAEIIE
jgi:hypothetical protein